MFNIGRLIMTVSYATENFIPLDFNRKLRDFIGTAFTSAFLDTLRKYRSYNMYKTSSDDFRIITEMVKFKPRTVPRKFFKKIIIKRIKVACRDTTFFSDLLFIVMSLF